jgi:hypothetical protein
MTEGVDLFDQINNAVLDLQGSQLQTFERPLKTLARLLHHPDLEEINRSLTERVDFDAFMAESEGTGGGMAGSHQLAWPDDHEQILGLTILLIDRLAADANYATNIGFKYFYSGNKIISGIHALTRQIIIPFARDYKTYVSNYGKSEPRLLMPMSRKVFIVHGHDEGMREAVARFLERIGFEAIILHEQANQGRTVIEKVIAHGDVGFAVVLLTPDDEGGKKGETAHPRARQNVLLELGYFVGRLGRERVCALKRGDLELPSDFGGVVYEPFDAGGGWRQSLGRELQAAGFDVDWNKVMRP